MYYAYEKLEPVRVQLLRDKTKLKIEDFGAGSRVNNASEKTVHAIAKSAVMPEKYVRLVYRIVHKFHPEKILEIGTSLGLTSMYMASSHQKTALYTIEGCRDIYTYAKSKFERGHFSSIRPVYGQFDAVLPATLQEMQRVDFALIDGNHTEAATLRYFELLLSYAHNETILVFDDIHWSDGMESAWKKIQEDQRVTVCIDLFFVGIVFLKKELHKENFEIRF